VLDQVVVDELVDDAQVAGVDLVVEPQHDLRVGHGHPFRVDRSRLSLV
jgi:hypothetical protein